MTKNVKVCDLCGDLELVPDSFAGVTIEFEGDTEKQEICPVCAGKVDKLFDRIKNPKPREPREPRAPKAKK